MSESRVIRSEPPNITAAFQWRSGVLRLRRLAVLALALDAAVAVRLQRSIQDSPLVVQVELRRLRRGRSDMAAVQAS
jgi:hypothetical protein